MKLLKRIKCFFIGHKWSSPIERFYNIGFYDQENWLEYTCLKCGKIKTEDVE